jgi:O-antigen/teichoic acid export membrane protein
MQIGRSDILWNYAATFFKIAAGVLLLPFILKMMSSEEIGIWTIFITISAFIGLLDFGFTPSFTRNVTYIFSGVNNLKVEGFETTWQKNNSINYNLLKSVISAMKWFYFRMSLILFILLITLGSYYIYLILKNYSGDHKEIYIAWGLLCIISTYNLYTLYYDSLLQGKGLIKKSKQIIIVGQLIYLISATILILFGYGLIAVIASQALSVITVRILSYRVFFTKELKEILRFTNSLNYKAILKSIYPNALKIGLTALGGFLVTRSSIFIGSLYLSLDEIASYGITMQLLGIITAIASIYLVTYLPKITQYRVVQNNLAIKKLYIKGQFIILITFIAGGTFLLFFGDWSLALINSKTVLLPKFIFITAVILALLENNHSIAGNIILTKNEVPFYKASLLSGALTILLLIAFFNFTNLGIWVLVIAPGFAQAIYQNWKWPYVVMCDLNIKWKDYLKPMYSFFYLCTNNKETH